MYNSFTAGTKAEPQKYNDLLRKISREFREAEVKATILDLRHNTGGTPDCVQLLGTILAPESRLGTSMAYLEYSDKQSEKNREITLDREVLKGGVNLNQQLLFVITSGETAGMAEMLISGLYRENEVPAIITIGSATKGQNMATESFANEELRWLSTRWCAPYTVPIKRPHTVPSLPQATSS
ncbi:carboxyl-terminal protease [Bacteroides pyogenes JCM 6292]|uniref:Carboxyl-terminal protease n=2 Tax=Bacteroides pyogenes TaxID=310300 RepID=W4PH50_9BACE|nr:carboxyl-terminal protease [Bacteroides pyogenes JCM 6292]GAE18743.1 carboxyl-terminal protease [Bacteroides pyogenes DSM 20611 = JCM 6294]